MKDVKINLKAAAFPDQFVSDAQKDTLDGVKFTWDDRWVHFRKSNTEPIMRIYAEAPNKIQAEELVEEVKSLI